MSEKKQKKQQKNSDVPGKPFKKDDPRINREGRPKGSKGFKTKFYEFLDKLAEKREVDRDDLEDKIYETYFKEVLNGDRSLLKDVLNRLHGKPLKRTDITTKGESVKGFNLTEEEKETLNNLLDANKQEDS